MKLIERSEMSVLELLLFPRLFSSYIWTSILFFFYKKECIFFKQFVYFFGTLKDITDWFQVSEIFKVKVLSESYQFLRLCGRRSPTGNLTNGRLITIICRGGFRVYFHICREKKSSFHFLRLLFFLGEISVDWFSFHLIRHHPVKIITRVCWRYDKHFASSPAPWNTSGQDWISHFLKGWHFLVKNYFLWVSRMTG